MADGSRLSAEGSRASSSIDPCRIGQPAAESKMATKKLDPNFNDLLRGRYVATLGTENADGTIHLTAVWYLFEDGCLFKRLIM